MTREESIKYYEDKRQEVLKRIKPLLEDFLGLKSSDYDYVVEIENTTHPKAEYLKIRDDKIGCMGNSILAVELEALGWVFIRYWNKHSSLGTFEIQTRNVITRYWQRENHESN